MSVAWTTIFVIALLMPGVGFFIGYWARERYSREIVKSTAVGEIGMAILIAIAIHLLFWFLLWFAKGFDPSFYFRPLADFDTTPHWLLFDQLINRLWPSLLYLLVTSAFGVALGYGTAWMVMFGWLRSLATHAWAYDLIKEVKRGGTVTTYVFTTTVENKRAVMYVGHLEDFYLEPDGSFSYIVMKDCQRFFMNLDGEQPTTGPREALFRVQEAKTRKWEHLVIDGKTIANILFDPSVGAVSATPTGKTALEEALRTFQEEQAQRSSQPVVR